MGYKKKNVWEIKCEGCGKVVESMRQPEPRYSYGGATAPNSLPAGWVDIHVTATPGRSQNRVDPPVCSKECAVKYVEKRYAELTKPKPAKKKTTTKKATAKKSTARKTTAARRRRGW